MQGAVVGTIEIIDIVALVWFAAVVFVARAVANWPGVRRRSITGAVARQRHRWMRGVALRDNRSGDAIILSTLSQGNAFFASTSAIAIGGLSAIVGSGDKADAFLARLPVVAKSSPLLWEIKVLLLIGIFVFAFFKFAWAFRLTHYTAIMIGATPEPGTASAEEVQAHVRASAELSALAADHANTGLRSFYYAVAVMAWFFHPVLFIAATAFVTLILVRREYFSRSRAIIDATP